MVGQFTWIHGREADANISVSNNIKATVRFVQTVYASEGTRWIR